MAQLQSNKDGINKVKEVLTELMTTLPSKKVMNTFSNTSDGHKTISKSESFPFNVSETINNAVRT